LAARLSAVLIIYSKFLRVRNFLYLSTCHCEFALRVCPRRSEQLSENEEVPGLILSESAYDGEEFPGLLRLHLQLLCCSQ
jgi:hypothetical protein